MKIATWNINSVRARKAELLGWLEKNRPDVLCLQETKVPDDEFPLAEIEAAGYRGILRGQRGYNGVAILARGRELEQPMSAFGDGQSEESARFLAATVSGVRVISAYVPNGKEVESESYFEKIDWLARLRGFLDREGGSEARLVLCGDFNVAPEARDVWDPVRLEGTLMCTDVERKALKRVVDWGLTDAFRHHHPDASEFSWWDYRMQSFKRNRGVRIDMIYLSPPLLAVCKRAVIDREPRGAKNASDHAPVWIELA